MKIKAKLRKIGNSIGVLIPKEVITNKQIGEIIDIDVITKNNNTSNVIIGKGIKIIAEQGQDNNNNDIVIEQ